jgi:hypothetical protein
MTVRNVCSYCNLNITKCEQGLQVVVLKLDGALSG